MISLNSTTYRLGNLDNYQAKLNFQMGGSKLQFGSDDSVTFGRLTHTEDKIKTEIGVKNQLERVNVLNLASDVALKTTKQNIEYIKSELIKANTSTTTSEGLDAIAKNIEKMKQNLFDLANTQTEGQYLFSGSDASVKPFSMDSVTGKVTYNGNDKLRSVIVEDGSYRNAGVNGLETFYYTADSALKNNLQTFVNGDTLTDNSGNTFDLTLFTAPATDATPPIPTAPLAPEKYTVTKTNLDGTTSPEEIYVRYNLAGDLETVIPNEVLNFKVADRILDQDGNEWVLNIPTNDTLTKTNWDGSKVTLPVTINTDPDIDADYKVTMPTDNGTKFEAKRSMFDMLDEAIKSLKGLDDLGNPFVPSDPTANYEFRREGIKKAVGEIDKVHDALVISHADLGSKNNTFNVSHERVESKINQLKSLEIELGSSDLTQVSIELKALEISYTALYSTINRTFELSLTNFLK